MIELWRNQAPTAPVGSDQSRLCYEFIFPSGRQALAAALQQTRLTRKSRIALPEWSSQCVIYAVGKVATPIPMTEVLEYDIPVAAVLLYEQWGWPLPEDLDSAVPRQFGNTVIILDRVDSADIENKTRPQFHPQNTQIDVISLSKLLGLRGGGLASIDGNYLEFHEDTVDTSLAANMWQTSGNEEFEKKLLHIHQNDVETLHKDLKRWLENNELASAVEQEAAKRRDNLSRIMDSPLSSDWPGWMFDVFEKGAAPGIVPLFRNIETEKLQPLMTLMEHRHEIETTIYHFNFSGNPLEPNYQGCLAFPIHGLVTDMNKIVQTIAHECKA